jgi:hypothetical protein
MEERPVMQFARSPDGVRIAYQISGDGPLDILFLSALAFPIDLLWDDAGFIHFAKRLGGFSRTRGGGWALRVAILRTMLWRESSTPT